MGDGNNQALSLATMDHGAVVEQVDEAIARVMENIVDPNTKAKAARVVTLKIKLVPTDEERELLGISAEVKTSMAPAAPVLTKAWVAHTRDGVVCVEHDPAQRNFLTDDDGSEEPVPLRAVQGGDE